MKLITWNCQMAFAGDKAAALFGYAPDVAVVQECSHVAAALAAEAHGYTHLWFGNTTLNASHALARPTARRRAGRLTTGEREGKGLAVFAREPYSLELLSEPEYTWVAPVRVRGPREFLLLAVWACRMRTRGLHYVDVVQAAVRERADWFERGEPVVLAGDLNSSAVWDTPRSDGHGSLVRYLAKRGVASVYHDQRDEAHGEETAHTFCQYRHAHRTYHIDYIFLPQAWMAGVRFFEIGGAEWLRLSDHLPLYVELE